MKRTKEEAEITRSNILEAALKVFITKGYRGTRLDDIANEALVTKGAIYWHFENKYDLFHKLMLDNMPDIRFLKSLLVSEDSSKEKISKALSFFFEAKAFKKGNAAFFRLLQVIDVNREELGEFFELLDEERDRVISILSKIIENGIDAGEVPPHVDPYVVGHALFCYGTGFASLNIHDSKFDMEKYSDKVIEIMIRGLF